MAWQGVSQQAPVQALAGEGDSLLNRDGREPGEADLLADPAPSQQNPANGFLLSGEGPCPR